MRGDGLKSIKSIISQSNQSIHLNNQSILSYIGQYLVNPFNVYIVTSLNCQF